MWLSVGLRREDYGMLLKKKIIQTNKKRQLKKKTKQRKKIWTWKGTCHEIVRRRVF